MQDLDGCMGAAAPAHDAQPIAYPPFYRGEPY
eukprot:COSAG05_NODE_4176_length_1637_cov_1.457737_1_plen_31_part_10